MWIGNDYVLDDRTRDGAVRDGSQLLVLSAGAQRGPARPVLLVVVVVVDQGSTVGNEQ